MRLDLARAGRLAAIVWLSMTGVASFAAAAVGPDNPRLMYWFRTQATPGETALVPDAGTQRIALEFGAGRYQTARSLAASLLADPERHAWHVDAWEFLAESYLAEGDFHSARTVVGSLAPLSPALAVELEGRLAAREAAYKEAIARVGEPQAVSADSLEQMLSKAVVEERFGRISVALPLYRRVLAESSVVSASHARAAARSIALIAEGEDPGRAVALAKESLLASPRSESLCWSVAGSVVSSLLGCTSAPVRESFKLSLREVISAGPNTEAGRASLYALGCLYAQEGLLDQAVREWQSALDLLPPGHSHRASLLRLLAPARVKLAEAAYARDDLNEAISQMSAAVRFPSPDRSVYGDSLVLAAWYCSSEHYEEALSVYQGLLPAAASIGATLLVKLDIALCYQKLDRHQEAVNLLQEILTSGPDQELALRCQRALEESREFLRTPDAPGESPSRLGLAPSRRDGTI